MIDCFLIKVCCLGVCYYYYYYHCYHLYGEIKILNFLPVYYVHEKKLLLIFDKLIHHSNYNGRIFKNIKL